MIKGILFVSFFFYNPRGEKQPLEHTWANYRVLITSVESIALLCLCVRACARVCVCIYMCNKHAKTLVLVPALPPHPLILPAPLLFSRC